jgi:ubiquitin C-terminal hydrolase
MNNLNDYLKSISSNINESDSVFDYIITISQEKESNTSQTNKNQKESNTSQTNKKKEESNTSQTNKNQKESNTSQTNKNQVKDFDNPKTNKNQKESQTNKKQEELKTNKKQEELKTYINNVITSNLTDTLWLEKNPSTIRQEKIPINIRNIGGLSCFMDTYIQCLFWTPELLDNLKNDARTIDTMNTNTDELNKTKMFGKLFLKIMYFYFEKTVYDNDFQTLIKAFFFTVQTFIFDKNTQQDVTEFITLFLDILENQFKDFVNMFKIEFTEDNTCNTCKIKSTKQNQVLFSLQLQIPKIRKTDIESVLNAYFKEEVTDSNNYLDCSECKKKTPYKRDIIITKFPTILCISYKRFKYSIENGKINISKVSFQITVKIDLNIENEHYSLYGFICHEGNKPTSGHYTTCIKTPYNRFYFIDDLNYKCPVEINEKNFLNRAKLAYVLFYKKINL